METDVLPFCNRFLNSPQRFLLAENGQGFEHSESYRPTRCGNAEGMDDLTDLDALGFDESFDCSFCRFSAKITPLTEFDSCNTNLDI